MHYREAGQAAVTYRFHEATGVFSLEVVTTFAVEPDPFALTVAGNQPSALLVRVNGKDVIRKTDRLEPGAPLRVESVAGIVDGKNEFYLEANPPVASTAQYNAVRMRVLRDGQVLGERSSWSESGARIADTFALAVAAEPRKEHAHDH
jgi:hypothetical protein